MRCYFCVAEPSNSVPSLVYQNMLEVALKSARENTNLDLYALYDGSKNGPFAQIMKKYDVSIIEHRFSQYESLKNTFPYSYLLERFKKKIDYKAIAGTFLRLDLPFIETKEEVILYCDMDVMFTGEIKIGKKPKLIAAAPEFSKDITSMNYFNAGVLLMNLAQMREKCCTILDDIKKNKRNKIGVFDQGYLNQYCFNESELLPLEYNWKPYWGYSESARIIHFHGIKPSGTIENSGFDTPPQIYTQIFRDDVSTISGYIYYLLTFYGYLGKCDTKWIMNQVSQILNSLSLQEALSPNNLSINIVKQYIFLRIRQKLHLI